MCTSTYDYYLKELIFLKMLTIINLWEKIIFKLTPEFPRLLCCRISSIKLLLKEVHRKKNDSDLTASRVKFSPEISRLCNCFDLYFINQMSTVSINVEIMKLNGEL